MDILDTLSSAMGSSEADAASAPANPQAQQQQWLQKFLLQHLIAQKFGEQKAQTAQTQHQADPVYQAKVQQAQQKMAPQPSIAQLISGGAGQPSQPQAPDTIFQGSTPGTGTPFFSNRPEAIGQMFGPEAQAGFEAKRASVQPPPAAPGAPGAPGGLDQAGARAALAAQLKEAKVPDKEIENALDARFGTAAKPVPIEKLSKLFKYNPATNDFTAAPANLTEKQMIDEGYRAYDDKTRTKVAELSDVDLAFQQFRSALNDIQGKNALQLKASELSGGNFGGPEGAIFKKDSVNFTTIFDKFLGGVRGAASPQMQKIRSAVLPSIISSGKVSGRLMSDLESLIKTMSEERVKTSLGANVALDMNKLNSQADRVLQSAGMGGQQAGGVSGATGGVPSGRVPVINPQGKTVTLPAEQISAALKAGYKPYQQ